MDIERRKIMKWKVKVYLNFEFSDEDPDSPDYAKDQDSAIALATEIVGDSKPHDFEWDIKVKTPK